MKSSLLILSFCLGTFSFCQSNYENGMKAFQNGHSYDAYVFFSLAIDNKEDVANSYMMRGAASIQKQDFINASKDIDTSIMLDSLNYLAYVYGGRSLSNQGLYLEAITFYTKSIVLNPEYELHFQERGVCNMNILAYEKAILDFDNAIRINSKEDAHFINRGKCKLELSLYEEALKDFDAALLIKPSEFSYANKAVALFKLGKYEESILCYTIALNSEPWNDLYFYGRGMSYKALGNIELACKDFKYSAASGNKLAKEVRQSLCKD